MEEGKEIWTLLRSGPAGREQAFRMFEGHAGPKLRAGGKEAQEMFLFMNDTYIGRDDPKLNDEFTDRIFGLLPEYDQQAVIGVLMTRAMEEEVHVRKVVEHNLKPWWRRGFMRSFQK